MTAGKTASQSGHAFLESALAAPSDLLQQYRSDGLGTKVVLAAPNLKVLLRLHAQARDLGIPCALITDSGCANFFGGNPTVTALGVGPALRSQVRFLRKFPLVA